MVKKFIKKYDYIECIRKYHRNDFPVHFYNSDCQHKGLTKCIFMREVNFHRVYLKRLEMYQEKWQIFGQNIKIQIPAGSYNIYPGNSLWTLHNSNNNEKVSFGIRWDTQIPLCKSQSVSILALIVTNLPSMTWNTLIIQ